MKKFLFSLVALTFLLISCTSKQEFPKNFNLDLPCVIYYSSNNCGWCKKFDPTWNEVSKDPAYKDINFIKGSAYSAEFGIRSVPAFVFISKDKVVTKMVGYRTKSTFENNIQKTIPA